MDDHDRLCRCVQCTGIDITAEHKRMLGVQARLIADVRAVLGDRSDDFTDEVIWRRAIKHGPFETPEPWAASLLAASAAADEYATALAVELGVDMGEKTGTQP